MRGVIDDLDVRQSFARDASGLELVPESVARPKTEAEVVALLRDASADGVAVTPAGGQTSTTGASITDRGILLSLRDLTDIGDVDRDRLTVRAQAGVNLGDLKRRLAAEGLLFAPDPTSEDDVTLGGAMACNASGARSLLYGATRPHIAALRVALGGWNRARAAPHATRKEHGRVRAGSRPDRLVHRQRRNARRHPRRRVRASCRCRRT